MTIQFSPQNVPEGFSCTSISQFVLTKRLWLFYNLIEGYELLSTKIVIEIDLV